MGRDLCLEILGIRIPALDTRIDNFLHSFAIKIVKTENKWKRGHGWQILNRATYNVRVNILPFLKISSLLWRLQKWQNWSADHDRVPGRSVQGRTFDGPEEHRVRIFCVKLISFSLKYKCCYSLTLLRNDRELLDLNREDTNHSQSRCYLKYNITF